VARTRLDADRGFCYKARPIRRFVSFPSLGGTEAMTIYWQHDFIRWVLSVLTVLMVAGVAKDLVALVWRHSRRPPSPRI
jgi:hypothetical protein